ncbi:MAG: hypothetical protein ACFBSG_06400 [Leptolyngbyaceae cyanobacterium]
MLNQHYLWVTVIVAGVSGLGLLAPAIAEEPAAPTGLPTPYIRPAADCPADLGTMTQGLTRDLPRYVNLVARRTVGAASSGANFGTVVIAGAIDLDPLSLETLTFETPDSVQQVFITTLERQYTDSEIVYLELYHWLFMVPVEDGWQLTLMFSRVAADDDDGRPPTPPQESSDGIVGQAIRLWLRDCRAGAVYPIEAET